MPELRKDPIIGRWVIIATERGKRPSDFAAEKSEQQPGFCPFCPGNEDKTPQEILAYRPANAKSNGEGWWVRVVPNKFPALGRQGEARREGDGIYDKMDGVGAHEVIIETPHHDLAMADYEQKQIQEILWAYRERILALKQESLIRYTMLFKNHGQEAGASLNHPHSQLIGLPILPKRVKEELGGALEYYRFRERCVFCDMIRQEKESQKRIVFENDAFIAICPYASRFPFEVWILPTAHAMHFHEMQKKEIHYFAEVLKQVLGRIQKKLSDPPFNFMLHTSPCNETASQLPHYHWHLEITPKLTHIAGFEWGTGFYINPMPPENAAGFLQENHHENRS